MRAQPPIFLLALSLAACGGADDATAVLLSIEAEGSARPFTATLDWLGPDGSILAEQPVPQQGVFPLADRVLATVRIKAGAEPPGERRALVQGRIDASRFFWGAARVTMRAGEVVDATVILRESMLEPFDADDDRIPDVIDDCDGEDDRLGC